MSVREREREDVYVDGRCACVSASVHVCVQMGTCPEYTVDEMFSVIYKKLDIEYNTVIRRLLHAFMYNTHPKSRLRNFRKTHLSCITLTDSYNL